jgi:hypothetical protein
MNSRHLFLALLFAIISLFNNCSGPAERQPNVIIIFTDDQGYADVGCFGAVGFKLPILTTLLKRVPGLQVFMFRRPCAALPGLHS